MLLGLSWLWPHGGPEPPWRAYGLALAAVLGAVGLLWHQHAAHPGVDVVNVQHRLFALTALVMAAGLFIEHREGWGWRFKRLVFPAGLLVLGAQLLFFLE